MDELMYERIYGPDTEGFKSYWMERGNLVEEEARNVFAMKYEIEVEEVGFITTDDGKYGCSPDGLISPNEGLEIKCPKSKTYMGYVREWKLKGTFPIKYIPQVQGSMLVTGFSSWNFMVYVPGAEPLIIKVKRDDAYCAKLKVELDAFCSELDEITAKLRGM